MTEVRETIKVTSGQLQTVSTSNDRSVYLPVSTPCPSRDWTLKALPRCFSRRCAALSKGASGTERFRESYLMSSTCSYLVYLHSQSFSSSQHALYYPWLSVNFSSWTSVHWGE